MTSSRVLFLRASLMRRHVRVVSLRYGTIRQVDVGWYGRRGIVRIRHDERWTAFSEIRPRDRAAELATFARAAIPRVADVRFTPFTFGEANHWTPTPRETMDVLLAPALVAGGIVAGLTAAVYFGGALYATIATLAGVLLVLLLVRRTL
jgi:hypothetical protein